jgi:hypothetical protein
MANNDDANDVKRPRRRFSPEENADRRKTAARAQNAGSRDPEGSGHSGARRRAAELRVSALLNRELPEHVNPKRIYRIMKRNSRLLERCTGSGRGRKHDGVIVTLKPNLRWCSPIHSKFAVGAAGAST